MLVSPARLIVACGFSYQTTDGIIARIPQWYHELDAQVLAILHQARETSDAMISATNPYQIITTQVGRPLNMVNDSTQWMLALILAVEAVFVVVAVAVSSCFDNMR